MRLEQYHRETRDLTVSVFFVGPLLAFYEIGSLALDSEVRNGADVLLRSLFALFGSRGVTVFNLILLGIAIWAGIRVIRRDRPVFALMAPVLVESVLLAIFFAPVVLLFESRILPYLQAEAAGGIVSGPTMFEHLVLSAGAGVYEEILFRLLLVGSMVALMVRAARLKVWFASVVAIAVSSVGFAAFHHVGVYGEPFEVHAFLFRTIAGVLLAGIFVVRGFAVAVYTHFLYDVLVYLQAGAAS